MEIAASPSIAAPISAPQIHAPPLLAPKKKEGRMKGTIVSVPILYGTLVFPSLSNPKATPVTPETPLSDPSHTHSWTVFLHGETDLNYLISSVDFKLHDSYAQPVRTITSPPYLVEESGIHHYVILQDGENSKFRSRSTFFQLQGRRR